MNTSFFLGIDVLLLFLVVFLVEIHSEKNIDVFKPTILFFLSFLAQYILPLFLVLYNKSYINNFFYKNFFIYYPISESSLNIAIIYSSIGFIFFFVGYHFLDFLKHGKKIMERDNSLNYDVKKLKIVVGVYFLVSLLLIFLMFFRIGFHSILLNLSNRLVLLQGRYIYTFSYILLAIISYLYLYIKKKNTFFSVLFIVLSASVAFLFGSRQALIAPIAVYVVLYYYWVRRLSHSEIGIFLFLVALLYMGMHIAEERIIMGSVIKNPYGGSNLVISLLNRISAGNFIGIQQLSLIVEGIKHTNHFFGGKTLEELFVFFIPRSIFPNKPISSAGILSLTFLPRLYNIGTTLPPSLIGEFYMNFSLIGIVIGMFFFGAFYRVLYERTILKKRFIDTFIYSVFAVLMYNYIRGELFSPTILAILFIFTGVFAYRYICVKGGVDGK